MTGQNDFNSQWKDKLYQAIRIRSSEETLHDIIDALDETKSDIEWTVDLLGKLHDHFGSAGTSDIMLDCACRYPVEDLAPIRTVYRESGDTALAHRMLQERFVSMLRNHLLLGEEMIADVVSRGWGAAGVIEGNRIVATKIPKSGFLKEYLAESDPQRRREIYCHCPRIRDAVREGIDIPVSYCYCGAGFYKGVWEEILQRPVKIRVLKSIMQQDEVCSFEIDLS